MCEEAKMAKPMTEDDVTRCLESILECERCIESLTLKREQYMKTIGMALDIPKRENGMVIGQRLRFGDYLIKVDSRYACIQNQLSVERLETAEVKCIDATDERKNIAGTALAQAIAGQL